MSRTPIRRTGRLRAVAVGSALAVSLVTGAAPAMADDASSHPANGPSANATAALSSAHEGHHVEARTVANAPWNRSGGVTTQGISWF